jgi:hypothetical protein
MHTLLKQHSTVLGIGIWRCSPIYAAIAALL